MVFLTALFVAVALGSTVDNVPLDVKANITKDSIDRIREALTSFRPRDDISDLIVQLTEDRFRTHALYLSGAASNSPITTRRSNSISMGDSGIMGAVSYVQSQMTSYGFTPSLHNYRNDYGPNVVSVIQGTESPNELVILGAHLDSIPSTGNAPGANDDGSGSSALLAIAETIKGAGATFKKTIVLEHYTGEEQGLVGSRALAAQRRSNGDNVVCQLQQDMTAVKLSNDQVGVALVQDSRAVDLTFTAYVEKVYNQYKDSRLAINRRVLSGSDCCSDHQSYKENGFISAGCLEPRGYTGDPQYHRVGDVVARTEYSTLQGALTAQVALAVLADMAGMN